MTEVTPIELERELAEMSRYPGETPQLWRRALAQARAASASASPVRQWFTRSRPWLSAAALLIFGVTIGILALDGSMSRARSAQHAMDSSPPADAYRFKSLTDAPASSARTPMLGDVPVLGRMFDKSPALNVDGAVSGISAGGAQEPAQRQVVRKASVELRTADVRAAFVKTQMLVSEVGAEYIENSAISGEGEQMQADLTLRVSAGRVSEVLNALREIGTVLSQQFSGEDVTAQVVDLEARLANERRIEQELLHLLETRQDAELKDVLELRTHIGDVREQIERLQAQQNHLSRLVSLATVLVIIRHEGKPPEAPKDQGLAVYFARVMKSAWENGITGLADSIAWIASTLLGGLIWWTIAAAVLWIAWRKFAAIRSPGGTRPNA